MAKIPGKRKPTKVKTGRPTKYKAKFVEQAEKYMKSADPPMIEEFAQKIGVCRATLYNWGKKHQEFFDTLERIEQAQKIKLIKRGLKGTYNSNIVKLMLSANHGMHERSDKHLSGGLTFAEALHKEMSDSDTDS